MKRTYEFNYIPEEELYRFKYNKPDNEKPTLDILISDMELNTKQFYEVFFREYDINMKIEFINKINEEELDSSISKKGNRVFHTVKELYDSIRKELDEQL